MVWLITGLIIAYLMLRSWRFFVLVANIHRNYRKAKEQSQRQDYGNTEHHSAWTCNNFDCDSTVASTPSGEDSNYCVGCAPIAVNVSDSKVLEF